MNSSPLPYPIHPIADVVVHIEQGDDPWLYLNDFLHDWWRYAINNRHDLIMRPPTPTTTLEGERWSAFCAATVEELCLRTSFPCPQWIQQQVYFLAEPWFLHSQPSQREWLLATTPEPYRRRNVFVGGNVLDNKYELKQQFGVATDYSTDRRNVWTPKELEQA